MRNPNFRFVGLWPRQYGGGAGSGAAVLATSPPSGGGYKRADLLTETDIAKLRTQGVLPATPTWSSSKGPGASQSALAVDPAEPSPNIDNTKNGPKEATGEGWILQVDNNPLFFHSGHMGYGSGVRLPFQLTGWTGGTPLGLSYTNGEWHLTSSTGTWSWSVLGMTCDPTVPQPTVAGTKRGTTTPGAGFGTRLYFYKGVYVSYGSATDASRSTSNIPYYSTDRITWTACTCPTLNAGSAGGPGGSIICSVFEHPTTGQLIGVTAYGEILATSDGITWAKTAAKAAGATVNLWLTSACITLGGAVFGGNGASGLGLAANQIYYTADINSAPAPVALAGAFGAPGSAVANVAFHCGVLFARFPIVNGGTAPLVAASVGGTSGWVHAIPYSGYATALGSGIDHYLTAGNGFVWATGGGSSFVPFVRIDLDFGQMFAPVPDFRTGVVSYWYLRV